MHYTGVMSQTPGEREIYSIENPDPEAPSLPGSVVVRRDIEAVHEALGFELLYFAQACVRTFGDFHLALSGGSTPLPFYRRLMVDPAFRDLPWKRTHLWLVDERRVPDDDERCNWTHIADLLLDHSDIPRNQAHKMRQTHDDAAEHYEDELRKALAWREKGQDRLDFVLLGMGADAHTASLFPGSPALMERERLVAINSGPAVTPPDRVTMTYPLLNSARYVSVLVTGESKRSTVARLAEASARGPEPLAGAAGIEREYPILGVRPLGDGLLRWFLDHDACPR